MLSGETTEGAVITLVRAFSQSSSRDIVRPGRNESKFAAATTKMKGKTKPTKRWRRRKADNRSLKCQSAWQ